MEPVLCNVCGQPVLIYEAKHPEKAVCPEHCPEHQFYYDKWERGWFCSECYEQAPPDFNDID